MFNNTKHMSITSKILILASALVMAMPVAANAGTPDESEMARPMTGRIHGNIAILLQQ